VELSLLVGSAGESSRRVGGEAISHRESKHREYLCSGHKLRYARAYARLSERSFLPACKMHLRN